jgi:hypothetical protein
VAAGIRHFKAGPRAELAARTDTGELGVLVYPLIFHVQFTP